MIRGKLIINLLHSCMVNITAILRLGPGYAIGARFYLKMARTGLLIAPGCSVLYTQWLGFGCLFLITGNKLDCNFVCNKQIKNNLTAGYACANI